MRAIAVAGLLLSATSSAAAQELSLPIAVSRGAAPPVVTGRLVEVTLRFDRAVPESLEVVRLVRDRGSWRLGDLSRRQVSTRTREMRATAPAGGETLLLMRAPGQPGYLLDGPFQWPREPSIYFIAARWRRTIRGRWPRAGQGPLTWVHGSDEGAPDGWPQCIWHGDMDWECVGAPLDVRGVVFSRSRAEVTFGVAAGQPDAAGIERVEASSSSWARLVVARAPHAGAGAAGTPVVVARRLERPRNRPASLRLAIVADERVATRGVGASAFWISGDGVLEDTWLEFTGPGTAVVRVSVADLTNGPPDLLLPVYLPPPVAVFGRVADRSGAPAAEAVVALYRFVEADGATPSARSEPRVRLRVAVAEQRTNEDGEFRFDGLATEPYELLVMHPGMGRDQRTIEADGQPLSIVLSPRQAVGRVVRDGVPVRGVTIAVVPDLAEFATASDIAVLKGGETETDDDGRFIVALPARGAPDLRIGGAGTGVRRIRLNGSSGSARVDVGTVELGEPPTVSLVFEQSDGCDLLLSGPSGRAGMTLIRAVRLGPALFEAALPEAGRWLVIATCGSRERAVVPSAIDVTPGGPNSVRLTWPH